MGRFVKFQICGTFVSFMLVYSFTCRANECDLIAAQIAHVTGARVDSAHSGNGTIALTHPTASEIDFGCPAPKGDPRAFDRQHNGFLSFYSDSRWPTPEWFGLVAQGGAEFTGVSQASIRVQAENCLRRAIADRKGYFHAETSKVNFFCTGGPQYGGASNVDIEPK
jgi:hypothetical protein